MGPHEMTAEETEGIRGDADFYTMDLPLIEITFDPDKPDECGPSHIIVGACQHSRWGNALIAAAVQRFNSDPDDWRFTAKPGERFAVTAAAGMFTGNQVDVKDKHALVLIDGPARHPIPWDAIQDVTVTGSPVCA